MTQYLIKCAKGGMPGYNAFLDIPSNEGWVVLEMLYLKIIENQNIIIRNEFTKETIQGLH